MARTPGPITEVGITVMAKFTAAEAQVIDGLLRRPGADTTSLAYRRAVGRLAAEHGHRGSKVVNQLIRELTVAGGASSRSGWLRGVAIQHLRDQGLLSQPALPLTASSPPPGTKPRFTRTPVEPEPPLTKAQRTANLRGLHRPLLEPALQAVAADVSSRLRRSVDQALTSAVQRSAKPRQGR